MSKLHGGKRANSGKTSGWGYPKGTPLKLIKLPVQIADAIQAAKERMNGDDLIRLLNQAIEPATDNLNELPNQALDEQPIQDAPATVPKIEKAGISAIEPPTTHRRNNKSGYNGVSFHKGKGKWQANLREDGKQLCLGSFNTAEEAHQARIAYLAKRDGK